MNRLAISHQSYSVIPEGINEPLLLPENVHYVPDELNPATLFVDFIYLPKDNDDNYFLVYDDDKFSFLYRKGTASKNSFAGIDIIDQEAMHLFPAVNAMDLDYQYLQLIRHTSGIQSRLFLLYLVRNKFNDVIKIDGRINGEWMSFKKMVKYHNAFNPLSQSILNFFYEKQKSKPQ